MGEIQKAISGISGSRPPVLQARDSTLVKFNHSLSLTDGAQYTIMPHCQRHENHNGD